MKLSFLKFDMKMSHHLYLMAGLTGFMFVSSVHAQSETKQPVEKEGIKSYCIDFNWEKVYNRPKLARLGAFANSDPATHFA